MSTLNLFTPSWLAPQGVGACGTTRQGGVSSGSFDSLNLGLHVGDLEASVLENRRRMHSALADVRRLIYIGQVHGSVALNTRDIVTSTPTEADALVSNERGVGLVIQTADCLPVFFASTDGAVVGLAHAGWRGLARGVLENTVTLMRDVARKQGSSEALVAAFGPAIGPDKFEVGPDVRKAFADKAGLAELFFRPGPAPGKFLANLYGLASLRLGMVDVAVTGPCRRCTFSEPESFFSFRRDGQTGRQASIIWIHEKI